MTSRPETSEDPSVESPFVPVCTLIDLDENEPRQFQVGEEYIALVRTEGQVFAIRDVCSHADVALSDGDVDDCHIECWMHGSRFNLRTGEPDSPPAVRAVPVYPVRIEGDGDSAVVLVSVTA
jgi:3-phenylpropionate/trans-cinnamate dioxygenase ferredoxin subunit